MKTRRWFPPLAFAVLWVAVAAIRPNTTFHLAPLIVAAAAALGGREGRVRWAAAATAVAVAIALSMSRLGLLEGPSLQPFDGALSEAITAAIVGGILAIVVSTGVGPDPVDI